MQTVFAAFSALVDNTLSSMPHFRRFCFTRMRPSCTRKSIRLQHLPHMLQQPSEYKRELRGSYLKMPPYALLLRKKGANIAVDPEELARAQWFWERRPTKFVLSTEKAIIILTFYAILWAATIFLIPQALETGVFPALGYIIVGSIPIWSYLDARRYSRWNSDYRRAILRLLQKARH